MPEGMYIYCIAKEPFKEEYGTTVVGDHEGEVRTVRFGEIGAVVSPLPNDRCKIKTTRKNMLAHQRVMEEVMKESTILPVKFGTVAESSEDEDAEEKIKNMVLMDRCQELVDLLVQMEDKVELGLKALWPDMKIIYSEIVAENPEVARLKKKVARIPESKSYQSKITLGKLVKNALDQKRDRESRVMIKILKQVCVEYRENDTFGDSMITNGAFLVKKDLVGDFDARVEQLKEENDGRVMFRYIGPVPPCNFVELFIILK